MGLKLVQTFVRLSVNGVCAACVQVGTDRSVCATQTAEGGGASEKLAAASIAVG